MGQINRKRRQVQSDFLLTPGRIRYEDMPLPGQCCFGLLCGGATLGWAQDLLLALCSRINAGGAWEAI